MLKFLTDTFEVLCQQPVVFLLVMAIPLLLVAWLKRVFPSRAALWLVAVPALFSLAFTLAPTIGWYLAIFDLAVVVILMIDLLTIVPRKRIVAERKCLKIASLDKSHDVEIAISNHSSWFCNVEIRDDLPDQFSAKPEKFSQRLDGKSRSFFEYKFKSTERGKFHFNVIHVKVKSLFGLWRGYFKVPVSSEINVYPDMKQIAQFDLLARTNRLRLLGVRRVRTIGTDNEFERLRDYTQDDNFRHIDWRTTARRRKLTVKDFQTNQSQRIIFLVDCGRMMTGHSGELTMLDHSLNAMLMLSYVALRQGDSVGLVCFSDKIHNYTPARAGVNHINRLLHASFDQRPEFVESRYDSAFLHVSKNCRKRALVVLLTNVIDEINANQIQEYLGSMAGKHLPMGVLLRDHDMFDVIDDYQAKPSTSVFEAAAAAEILTWRHQVINDLNRKGVLTMDVFPNHLTARLINHYLEIKARHLL